MVAEQKWDLEGFFLQGTTLTMIGGFDFLNGESNYTSGDIFISIDQVKENAISFNVELEEELRRIIIHGILHLLGFNDSSTVEKNTMREKENEALHLWFKLD